MRQSGELPIQGVAHGPCGLGAKLGEFGVAGFSFDRDLKGGATLSRNSRVSLPMAALKAFFDILGAVLDGNPLGDMGFSVFAGISATKPFFVSPDQAGDQMTSIRIDPLIDCLMADS